MMYLNNDGMHIFIIGIVFAILAAIAVVLRFLAKSLVTAKYGWDDWWIIFTLFSYYGFLAVVFWGNFGSGGGIDLFSPDFSIAKLRIFLKSLYISVPVYALSTTACKISILCMYRRIFAVPFFKRWTLFLGIFLVAFFLAAVIAGIFTCLPFGDFWNTDFCIQFSTFFLAIEIIETICDAVLLALPVRMISRLQMSKRNKVSLLFIFLLGGFIVITGIIRICLSYHPHSAYVNFVAVLIWSNLHLGFAIICACLPTYKPLLAKVAASASSLRSTHRQGTGASKSTLGYNTSNHKSERSGDNIPSRYMELNDRDNIIMLETGPVPKSSQSRNASHGPNGRMIPANAIGIHSTIEVV